MWRCLIATKVVLKSFGLRCWSHGIFRPVFSYMFSFPVENASVRQRVVLFFLCPASEKRERRKWKRETASLCADPAPPLRKNRRNRVFLRGGGGLYTGKETARGLGRNREKNKQRKTSQWFSEWILKCSFTCLFLLLVNWVGSVHVFWKTVLNSLIVLSLKITSHLELPTLRIPLVFHQSHPKKSKN